MVADIRQGPLFANLPEDQVQCVLEMGSEVTLQSGEVLFSEGDAAQYFYILLEGNLQITKRSNGQEFPLALHTVPGTFTGEIPLLTSTPHIATARAVTATKVLRYNAVTFRQLLRMCQGMLDIILSVFASRIQATEVAMMQQEKLAALGKLSAGLAHELNNPASAALSATEQLREVLGTLPETLSAWYDHDNGSELFCSSQQQSLQHGDATTWLDPLARSDLVDDLALWLEERGVAESWLLAPTFVDAGLDRAWFDTLTRSLDDKIVASFVLILEKILRMQALLNTVGQSTTRISTLVNAVKSYVYMDQAPLQDIDVHEGLENTLVILNHKLKNIEIVREYDRMLPTISAYGSELNQVWTNLLSNAIDALEGKGKIWLRTWRENDHVVVEVADNGPGIPEEIQSHIFEPFFTTKGVGKGSGLGLDIARRIIVMHHKGDLQVSSRPGATRFTVRLPIEKE
jgi:signal transduction histidine kinase